MCGVPLALVLLARRFRMRTVVGVFPSREEAIHVANDLNTLGIPEDEINIADSAGANGHEKEWSRRNIAACAGTAFGWFLAALVPAVAEQSRVAAVAFGASVGGV